MSLFKWSKKAVEELKEEAPASLPEIKEYAKKAKKEYEEHEAKKKAEAEDSFNKAYMDAMKGYAYKTGSVTTTSSSVPSYYGYSGLGAFSGHTAHGAYIKLDDLQKLYNIEPYAVIKIAEYFAGLGISTEEQAKELIEELKRV